ncbi:MAG: hypothetical protein JNL67_13580 [Planctomycetaceae bacterium]|nr:hypothetical protein [Planctomycetaceae bacterium]
MHQANGGELVLKIKSIQALHSAGFTPTGARLGSDLETPNARLAVEARAWVANQPNLDRNGSRAQVPSVRTQDPTRSAYLRIIVMTALPRSGTT